VPTLPPQPADRDGACPAGACSRSAVRAPAGLGCRMAGGRDPHSFPFSFDAEFPVGPDGCNKAYAGTGVLRGLVEGIDEHLAEHERKPAFRTLGTALLAVVNWINDEEVIDRLAAFTYSCVVIAKKGRDTSSVAQLKKLHDVNSRMPGFPTWAFPELGWIAPREGDQPAVVTPNDRQEAILLPTIRTLGFRPRHPSHRVPWLHAKLALLGYVYWHDEDEMGGVADTAGFRPQKLWLSSANFTKTGRFSQDYGVWLDDPLMLRGFREYLVTLLGASEGLDPGDDMKPQFPPVEYDDEAFRDYMAEFGPWPDEDDDEFED
jgi:hypothetical protein